MLADEYGALKIPEDVVKLVRLEQELRKKKMTLDLIGLIPIETQYAYAITPIDVIPFANTGGDGIHFGFLTDFGRVSNLAEAPIICVTPTDDPPIRLRARSLDEFLQMATSVPHVELLERFWPGTDEEKITNEMEEFRTDEFDRVREPIRSRLRETFQKEAVDVASCIRQALDERQQAIALPTLDGLGVVAYQDEVAEKRYTFNPNRSQDEQELASMRAFLEGANVTEKLAFVRDASYWYILAPDYDDKILQLIREILHTLQLEDERKRLEFRNN